MSQQLTSLLSVEQVHITPTGRNGNCGQFFAAITLNKPKDRSRHCHRPPRDV